MLTEGDRLQLAATEIVRRCERRIGQLVREGQERGEIRRHGEHGSWEGRVHLPDGKTSSSALFTSGKEQTHTYALARADDDTFEETVPASLLYPILTNRGSIRSECPGQAVSWDLEICHAFRICSPLSRFPRARRQSAS